MNKKVFITLATVFGAVLLFILLRSRDRREVVISNPDQALVSNSGGNPVVPASTVAPPVYGTRDATPDIRTKPAPYLNQQKKEDLASHAERNKLLDQSVMMQERATPPDAKGAFTRKRVVRANFKYPFLRIEETWSRDAQRGVDTLQDQKVMVADHFLVTLREESSEKELKAELERLGGAVRRHLPNSRVYLVEIGSTDLDDFDRKLNVFRTQAAPMKYVEPDYIAFQSAIPNDPSLSSLWGMHNTGQTGGTGDADIDAPEAWEVVRGSSSVVVGVIDTGIDYNHPDLIVNMWSNAGETPSNGIDDDGNGYIDDTRGWDFVSNDNDPMDDHYHGTHCAGTIGAAGDNGVGVAGVCHTVKLMPLKFLSGSGGGTTSDAIEAVYYATANHATLTSNSWGGGGYSQTLKDAIDEAGAGGILFIAAAGNSSANTDSTPSYPAAYDSPNIISVAATDHDDVLAHFSNYGVNTVDLAAPGVSIYSTSPGAGYRSLSGTSMACPHVAGACALLKSARPAMSWIDIKTALLANVDGIAGLGGKVGSGGRLNVARALIIATEPYVTLTAIQPADGGQPGSSGNQDGILNPGEDVTLVVTMKNAGGQAATGVTTQLGVNSPGGKVSVIQGAYTWGNMAIGSSASNTGQPFIIHIAPDTQTPHLFTLQLVSTDTDGHTWTSQVQMTVLTNSTVNGRVTTLTGGSGISGALISYSGTTTGSVVAAADGTYLINLTDGTYQLRATAPGYNPSQEIAVTLPPNAAAVNFELGRSRVQVSPASLSSTQFEDAVTNHTLTITNEGDQPLNFLANVASRSTASSSEMFGAHIAAPPVLGAKDAAAETQPAGLKSLLRLAAGGTSLPFSDSFESGTLDGWTADGSSGTREIVSTQAVAGSKSFHFNNTGGTNHFNGIHRDFAEGSKPKSISFWVRAASNTAHTGYFVLTDGTYGSDLIWFFARDNGKFYINGDAGGDESFNYQANLWYRVEFKDMDWTSKNFDYYVNGALVKANIPFRNASWVDDVSQLWLYNFSGNSEAWWDDVRLMDTSVDWLTMTPDSGVLAPGQSRTITVSLNAADKVAGDYLGQIEISSNDPVNPVVSVPVTMTVQPTPNTPPVADAQSVSLDEDTQAVITLTGSDAESHSITAQIQSLPTQGGVYQTSDGVNRGELITAVPTAVSNGAKKVIYVPPINANGIPYANFQFLMRDKRSQSNVAAVTLNVAAVNDIPVALNDSASGLPGQVITPIAVITNDVDPDAQTLTITAFTQGMKGTVANNGDGTLSFTPNVNFTTGEDSFTYTISDGAGGTATATVNVAVGLLAGGAWPMMGRDAAHTGFYPGTLNGQTFSPAWTLQVAPSALNQVSIAEGKVFATPIIYFNETQISAVDLMTGTLVWKKIWPVSARSLNGPAYHSGTVYVQRGNHSSDSQLWALSAMDGSVKWSSPFSAQWGEYLPPTVTDDAVYINGGSYGGMYGYDRTTGSQLFFNSSLEQYDMWTPAVYNNQVYSYVAHLLRQHHPTTGVVNWTAGAWGDWYGSAMYRTAALASGAAFVVNYRSPSNELVCIDLATHTVRWQVASGFIGTPSVADGRVYAFESGGSVKALDINNGNLLQTYITGVGSSGLYQPIVTNDALIASSSTTTAVHQLTTGTKLQTLSTGGIPSLSNGYLLLAGTDGILRCYGVFGSNVAPLAQNLTMTSAEDQPVTITLPGTDADANALAAIITSLPSKGKLYQTVDGIQIGDAISLTPMLVRNPDRKVIYFPAPDGFGTAYSNFKFKIHDGTISSGEATVTVNVTGINDAPVATGDVVYLRAGSILVSYLPTANDKDADGEPLQIVSYTQPAKGALSRNPDGSFRYVPQTDFTEGSDSFQYTLQDGAGLTATGTVQVLVSADYGREWTQFGNGADHTGRYPGSLGIQSLVQRWEATFPSSINPLAVAGGKVFVTPTGAWNNYMDAVALDAMTGAEAWRVQFQPGNSLNPPSYHRGIVYMQRGNHYSDTQLWALNATDGSVKWSAPHRAQWERYFSPAVSDLGVYINGGEFGGIYGFDRLTGAQKFFNSSLEQEDQWTPGIYEGQVYSFVKGKFRNHHPELGTVLWTLDLTWNSGSIYRTICFDAGRAYVANSSTSGAELVCIDLQTKNVGWRIKDNFTGTPAVSNGIVYACSNGQIKSYNSITGTWIGDFIAPGETLLNGAPVVSNDLLIIGSSTKTYLFSLVTRQLLQAFNFGSRIAIANDVLYFSCSDNKVRAFGQNVPSNHVPVAQPAQVGIQEDSQVVITLEGTDADGEALNYVVQTMPAQGTLYQTADGFSKGSAITQVPAQVLSSSGGLIYAAPSNAFGAGIGSFVYTAHDQVTASLPATVAINVSPVNDPPSAVTDIVALRPGELLLNFRPEANDRDPDGDILSVVAYTQGASGQVTQSADGSLQYTPNAGFNAGTDSFNYTIRDAQGVEAIGTVEINVSVTMGRSWPTFGANAEHTGFLPVRMGSAPFIQRWQTNLAKHSHQLAVADGKVFASLQTFYDSSSLVALDATTGGELWRSNFTQPFYMNPPTWFGGNIFLQYSRSSDSRLYCFNATTGETRWNSPFSAQSDQYLAPAVESSGAFINGGTYGGLYGFNQNTGSQLFFQSLDQYDQWTPTLHNGGLYSFVKGVFRSHHKSTGATLWSLDFGWKYTNSSMNRTTVCANNRAYLVNDSVTIPSGEQDLIGIDLITHSMAWKVRGKFTGTPAFAHDAAYALSNGNSVKTYDGTTGLYLGVYTLPGTDTGLLSQPIVTNDVVIASSATKTYIFDLASHALRQTINYGGNISLAGDSLYIASSDCIVRAFVVPDFTNHPPAAVAQAASTQEDSPITVTLQGTDTDNDTLTFAITALPALGKLYQTADGIAPGAAITSTPALITNASGKVIYVPLPDRNGSPLTTFQFAASDSKALSSAATVTINVQSVNDLPIARNDSRPAQPGQIVSPLRELSNDFDVDGDLLEVTAFTQPALGVVARNADNTLRYHAPSNLTQGTDQFTYTVSDPSGASATATVTIALSQVITGAWPTFGNGPAHTGYSASALGRTGWAQRWAYNTSTSYSLQPVASAEGKVFASFRDGSSRVVAIDAATGQEQWSRSFASASSMNPPTYHNGKVYVQRGNHDSDTQLIALNSSTGATVWSSPHSAQWESYMAPAVSSLGAFVNGGYFGGIYGFSQDTGSQLFFQNKAQTSEWTPSILGSELYAFVNGDFVRHHPVTGAILWNRTLGWGGSGYTMSRTTALDGRSAYLVNDSPTANYGDEDLVCIDLDTHAVLWSINGEFTGTPAISNGIVYVISQNVVEARNASDGHKIASFVTPTGTYLSGQPVISDDLVIVPSASNGTFIFGRYDQVLLQKLNVSGSPAIVDDEIIISSPSTGIISAWASQPAITFTPNGGSFAEPVEVVIGAADPGTRIYYTVDGSAPDFTSPWLVSGSRVRMGWSGAIRAISIKGSEVSRIHEANFTITDSDADGISDWWENLVFENLSSASLTSDSDHDGATDHDEFLAGTDPRLSGDRFTVLPSSSLYGPGGAMTIRWQSKTDRLYLLETSTDLRQWNAASPILSGTGGEMQQGVNAGLGNRCFARVRVMPGLE